jgi:hypothetical protein
LAACLVDTLAMQQPRGIAMAAGLGEKHAAAIPGLQPCFAGKML